MTENERRAAAVAQARAWLGRGEHDGSHAEILRVYNAIRPLPRGYTMRADDPWCAAFVSAVGAAAGLTDILYPECGCGAMLNRYRAAGRFEENDEAVPRPGDVIFYDWQDSGLGDCRGEPDHVGLVECVEDNLIHVIEGNLSDKVGLRRIAVGARCIRGFGKPDYLGGSDYVPAEKTETPAEPVPPESAPATLALPLLRQGSAGESVRAAQLLLIGRGYRCGPWGADGDFGPATSGGVCRFQRGRQLEVDGVIGPITWRALLGG